MEFINVKGITYCFGYIKKDIFNIKFTGNVEEILNNDGELLYNLIEDKYIKDEKKCHKFENILEMIKLNMDGIKLQKI